jgi:4-diphosphocytidyl-2-C-methyl-D-erythritol kinase
MKWYPAPGKLNLFLHLLGKRETGEHAGYHELQTVFRLVDRADRVGIALREGGEIRFSGLYGDDNLCVRAARLLKQATGTAKGAELALEKILPVGGGLGGGSSDAATVLLVLNRLWNLNLPSPELMKIATRLGADVASGSRRSISPPPGISCSSPKSRFPRRKSSLPR